MSDTPFESFETETDFLNFTEYKAFTELIAKIKLFPKNNMKIQLKPDKVQSGFNNFNKKT
jgi:hypothetical protein